MTDVETHPYNCTEIGRIPLSTRILVIGTAPPPRFSLPRSANGLRQWIDGKNGDVDFYYGSADNLLWSCVFRNLFKIDFLQISAAHSRELIKQFLKNKKMWMRDVLQKYTRKRKDSALDRDLRPIEYTQFRPIFEKCSEISTIVLTGTCAEKWFGQQLAQQALLKPPLYYWSGLGATLSRTLPRVRVLDIDVRRVEVYTLPSPSPRAYDANDLCKLYGDVFRRINLL